MERLKKGLTIINKYKGWCALVLCPVIHFYLLEAYTHNGFTEVRHWSQVFNILLFEITAWILFLVFRSVRAALWTQGACAMVLGLVNYYVYTFQIGRASCRERVWTWV